MKLKKYSLFFFMIIASSFFLFKKVKREPSDLISKNTETQVVQNQKDVKENIKVNPSNFLAVDDYQAKIIEARKKSPDLEEISKSYDSIDDQGELQKEYNRSEELMKKLDLIAKANAAKLTSEELVIFTTELRKQGVISVRLAELELKKYEDHVGP
ncbi:MAG: hypothetical protein QE271_04910 [Bacteriovoracaceae bacterium]|nr:hypothetical protein [Bacteriovoracaceae bacterium]